MFSILAPLTDKESGAFAWAATKVNIEKTDEWVRVPKFENTVPDLLLTKATTLLKLPRKIAREKFGKWLKVGE